MTASDIKHAKDRMLKRALAATRKRHAHVLADKARTEFQNERRDEFQNDANAPSRKTPKSLEA